MNPEVTLLTIKSAGRRLALLVVAAGALLVAAPTAAGAVAPNGTAQVDATGMRFTGLNGANQVTVGITGNRFLIKDIAPITAGPGCVVAGVEVGKFGVFCQIPLNANGTRRPFRVNLGGGDDTVTNTADVRMIAIGGSGNDTLLGGPAPDSLTDSFGGDVLRGGGGSDNLSTNLSQNDGLVDVLDGGPGDDDLSGGDSRDVMTGGTGQDFLRGGLGPDEMDPGADSGDTVTYLDNVHNVRVVASLDGIANDGNNIGGISEGDNVAAHTPILTGGQGQDILIGSNGNNHMIGNLGDDSLTGNLGADFLEGNNGNDTLTGNRLFGVPVADGAIDTLNGGDNTDRCRVAFNEADITISCEVIDVD